MKYLFIILTIALIGSSSCSKQDDSLLIINIEKEFKIDIVQKLGDDPNAFNIQVSTLDQKECKESILNVTPYYIEDGIRLSIDGITRPVDCLSGVVNATENLSFASLGSMKFNVAISDVALNKGHLNINSNHYNITFDDHYGLEPNDEKKFKIPNHTAWGYFTFNNGEGDFQALQNISNEFFNHSELQENHLETPGNYGYFYINTELKTEVFNRPVDKPSIAFSFHTELTEVELRNLLKNIQLSYPGLTVNVATSKGYIL